MVRNTMQADIVEDIGFAIVEGVFPPGTVLRTDEFMEQQDASRSVVREALKVLESMRLVSLRRNVGVTIRPKSEWSLFDPRLIRWRLRGAHREEQLLSLTQLREAVEPAAARLAAESATPEERAELVRLAKCLHDDFLVRDLDGFHEHDLAFHRQLMAASHNEMFHELSDVVSEVLRGRRPKTDDTEHPTPHAVRSHILAAEHIREGNAAAAEDALHNVLNEVRSQLMGQRASGDTAGD